MIAGVSTPPGAPSCVPWNIAMVCLGHDSQERLHLRLHEGRFLKRQPDIVVDAARLKQRTIQRGCGFMPVNRDDSRHGRMLAYLTAAVPPTEKEAVLASVVGRTVV